MFKNAKFRIKGGKKGDPYFPKLWSVGKGQTNIFFRPYQNKVLYFFFIKWKWKNTRWFCDTRWTSLFHAECDLIWQLPVGSVNEHQGMGPIIFGIKFSPQNKAPLREYFHDVSLVYTTLCCPVCLKVASLCYHDWPIGLTYTIAWYNHIEKQE